MEKKTALLLLLLQAAIPLAHCQDHFQSISPSSSFNRQTQDDWAYLCESLICDPPKTCTIVDQVAQCLQSSSSSSSPPFGTINGGQPLSGQIPTIAPFSFGGITAPPVDGATEFSQPSPTLAPFPSIGVPEETPPPPQPASQFSVPPPPPPPPPSTTTQPSPFAPLLSLFGATPPPLLQAFTLPTLPPPPTTTTTPPVDVCSLPPLTGSCSRARIMWYFDVESRRCERFSYSGCGNENRFPSRMQCEQQCGSTRFRA